MLGPRVGVSAGAFGSIAAGVAANETGPTANKQIVLIIGQSNGLGRGDWHTLTDTSLLPPFAAVQLKQQLAATADASLTWTFYATDALQPRTDNPTINMGPELRLGHYLDAVQPGRWAVAKMDVGSSSLAVHWLAAGTYPAAQPNLFTQAMTYGKAAEVELGGKVAAIVWVQGESDATDPAQSAAYQANVTALLAACRANFPGVPFVFNRLCSGQTGLSFNSTVRAQQTAFAGASSNVAMVNCDDCALQGDVLHFTADGYDLLGKRFALAILAALGVNVPPVANFSSVTTGLSIAFTDASTDDDGTIVSRLWDFGDGNTSTSTNPTHVYASGATYNVKLTVTDNLGATNSITKPCTAIAVTWTVDATSSKATPATAAEWQSLLNNFALMGGAAPFTLQLMQEASGSLLDSVGSIVMAATGSPGYQAAVTGWSRKAVTSTDGGAQRFLSTDASLPDISTTSFLYLCYVAITGSPAAARGLCGLGGVSSATDAEARIQTTPAFRATSGGNVASSANVTGTTVHPVLIKVDRTAGVVTMYTDLEKLTPTFTSGMSSKRLQIGSTIGATAAPAAFLYGVGWQGAAAEISDATAKALLQAAGWTIPWT